MSSNKQSSKKKKIKTPPQTEEVPELFFTTFAGEYVRVILAQIVSETIETEEGLAQASSPMMVEGFLLDYDKEFYYIGRGPGAVEQAINKKHIMAIQIAEVQKVRTMVDVLMDTLPDNPSPEDIN